MTPTLSLIESQRLDGGLVAIAGLTIVDKWFNQIPNGLTRSLSLTILIHRHSGTM